MKVMLIVFDVKKYNGDFTLVIVVVFLRNWLLGHEIKRYAYGILMRAYRKCANQKRQTKKVNNNID